MFKKFFITLILILYLPVYAADDFVNMDFWQRFGDDYLYCYIKHALEYNHDLKKAQWRVEEYRQKVKISLGKEMPSVLTAPSYLGSHVPQLDNFELSTNAFILPFFVGYEADFFLKNRDKTKSEKKNYEIEKLNEKTLYISLVSDIASAYINIIKFDQLIEIQNKIVKNNKTLYEKAVLRYKNGVSSQTDLNNAKKNLIDSEDELTEFNKNRCKLLYQLAVLVGQSPDCTDKFLRGKLADIKYKPPESVSSDVIFARPDVQAAEKNLEKAKIDIRIARKEFLPSFDITGVWIFNTIASGSFFGWESSLAAIMAGAFVDIFAGGRKIANLKAKKAKYEQLFEEYKQTDLKAVQEVNTSLCMLKEDSISYNNINNKTGYESNNLKLVSLNYKHGVLSLADFLEG